ncbi:sulfite reductase subunit alpha [Herminiimonas fonticola]|uniref:NADPH--hemoprotein reductase n=1 Tax=Herminiimonas fonticola TaxID=303380 RepID=A0A4R6GFY0_9BURK|nr:sulfite reductase subunit alpha [Herminiimonas fonticola]RBA24636.1 Flavodoxin [Herminiimonas fonticola]TDN93753.1 sulfite reductase (NADPH) flavoprotein alpha-component [Herminiimonas fonticola]
MNWSDQTRAIVATILVAVYIALCAGIYYAQRRKRQQALRNAAALIPAADGAQPWLVGYASQTGFAEELAWHTARLLHTAGVPTRVTSLSEISASDLSQAERALFIVSTYGEGDPPDNASLFVSKLMSLQLALPNLHFGVLMLGDSEYANFCGFGRSLTTWLKTSGAQALFDSVFVDKAANSALQTWQHHLSHIAGTSDAPDWQAPSYQQWRLAARRHLNPGSAGAPTFHLELEAISDAAASWEAGDLVQVLAPDDAQRPREYSIASIPADGRVHLLVRQERREDGSLGIASGWLTKQAAVGEPIALRLRPHSNFRLGDNAHRPLMLIGNGTGLAGLRSHLKARAASGASRNWLIFGERNAAYDFYYRDEIETWQSQGNLERADLVFSRDQIERIYVQDKLREQAEQVRAWIAADAAVYVCGSLEGMAGGVEDALTEILGKETVGQLIAQGRYRRDVY